MKQTIFFITALLLCTLTGKAGTKIISKTDSLLKVLQTLPRDTMRLNVLNQIIRIEQMINMPVWQRTITSCTITTTATRTA